ncbi:hypothetical protein O9X98_14620 [Agrobacterium salinitolerans]|nr:hypothetical protein [Agrobacterium salinitolerans]
MTKKTFDHGRTHIHAKRAVIDVLDGWNSLNKHFSGQSDEAEADSGIPVLIKGVIKDAVRPDDPMNRQFEVAIEDLFFNCDHTVVFNDRFKGSFHFELFSGDLERLDSLAERTLEGGLGYMASATYHGQGRVGVPSHWLRALVAAYRAQHPETASFYYHMSEKADADGQFIKVALVSKDHWEQHKTLEGKPLNEQLEGRVPYGGVEVGGGIFEYRGRNRDELDSELHDAGFRENVELEALASAD